MSLKRKVVVTDTYEVFEESGAPILHEEALEVIRKAQKEATRWVPSAIVEHNGRDFEIKRTRIDLETVWY